MKTSQTAATISQDYQTHRTVSLPEQRNFVDPSGKIEKGGMVHLDADHHHVGQRRRMSELCDHEKYRHTLR
jgi:hypothetical protein